MKDPRIPQYREAARRFREGTFDIEVPIDPLDEVGLLGTELKQLGAVLERKFAEMRALADVTTHVNSAVLLDEILDRIFTTFDRLIPFDRIGMALLSDDRTKVCAYWQRSRAPSLHITAGYEAPLAGSSLEKILQTGRPRIINDLQEYYEQHPDSHSTGLVLT